MNYFNIISIFSNHNNNINNKFINLCKNYIENNDNNIDIIKDFLVNNCLDKNFNIDILIKNNKKTFITIFMYACKMNKYYLIELLLQYGANINIIDKNGRTQIMYACMKNDVKLVILLLKYNADVNIKTEDNYCALYYTCLNNNLVLAKILSKISANTNILIDLGYENNNKYLIKIYNDLIENSMSKSALKE